MRYLYAIIEAGRELPPLQGLAAAPLELVTGGALAAVVSTLTARPAPDEATLWAHEHVVETIMADRVVLPVRFGTLLGDDAAVQAALIAGAKRFHADLSRLAGCVEISLRVLWVGAEQPELQPDPDTGAPGRAYLEARLAETRVQRERRMQALAVHTRLEPLARESRIAAASGRMVFSAAYLLPVAAVTVFRSMVAAADAEYSQWRLICTGPWPPYSFVSRA
ncbi:MAG: GvpL/GvpF family gas vesicle protein [Oscillochloris sp.]|nr:GvpL/GvpF family gas vesicle protein [Oscillochloris sp.]